MVKRALKCAFLLACVYFFHSGTEIPAMAFADQKASSPAVSAPAGASRIIRSDFGQIPVNIIPNRGQWDGRADYYIQGKDKTIFFGTEGVTFVLTSPDRGEAGGSARLERTGPPAPAREDRPVAGSRWVVKLDFLDARSGVKPQGTDETGTRVSYFGGAPEDWKTDLPAYSRIVYRDIWPGIDLAYTGTMDRLKYEFVVHPGADPSQIRLAYRGATSVAVDAQGRLAVSTPAGGFEDGTPVAYQEKNGARVDVPMGYKILDNRGLDGRRNRPETAKSAESRVAYGFTVGAYDPAQTLILDPVILVYCGYIGGPSYDYGYGIAADSAGSAYITGYTYAPGAAFPAKVGPDLTYNGGSMDAFVAKLNPEGTAYVYCGYIGGSGNDYGYGIAVDAFGSAYVTGYTSSGENTFPVKVGPDLTANGNYDVFVAKVNPKGTNLDYCGYIGGSGPDFGKGIAVDGTGNAYVTGYTNSSEVDFPVTVGPFLTFGGNYDAFVAKVKPDGSALVYCGYIGGPGEDVANAIAVDGLGCAYITGFTFSGETTFPVTSGPILTHKGLSDAFVAKVNNDGASLAYCGYIGGSGSDIGTGIAVDLGGNAYICGYTNSTESSFPVTVGPGLAYNGGSFDGFVAKLDAANGSIAYAGYIGGGLYDVANAIAIDGRGYAFVIGYTSSKEDTFPVKDGPSLTHVGSYDVYVAKVDIPGSKLLLCGYLGGTDADLGMGIALGPDASGDIYLTGNTYSNQATFPVLTGPDLTAKGSRDGFVAKLSETSLAVTSPNGAETLHVGFNWIITWLAAGKVDKVTIQYSVNNGTDWFMVAYAIPNTGSYLWNVPDDVSSNCLVRVSEAATEVPTDSSDAVFTISNDPIVVVTSPNGGEKWAVGSSQAVTWQSGGAVGDVKIEYSTDGGTSYTVIVDDTQNTGTYTWVVPDAVSDLCVVRITDISVSTTTDMSDLVFSIVPASSPAASPAAKAGTIGPGPGSPPGAKVRRRFIQGESH